MNDIQQWSILLEDRFAMTQVLTKSILPLCVLFLSYLRDYSKRFNYKIQDFLRRLSCETTMCDAHIWFRKYANPMIELV